MDYVRLYEVGQYFSLYTHLRVEPAVNQIHGQVNDNNDDDGVNDDSHYKRGIAGRCGVDDEISHARQSEDFFDDNGSAEHSDELEREHCKAGWCCCAENMLDDDLAARDSSAGERANEVAL